MAKKYGLEKRINNLGNVMKVDNLPYHEFLNVASNASCILTDGGGQTEEAAFLQIPCVIFRKYNERKEAEEENCAIRVGSNPKKAIKYVKEAVEQGEFYQKVKASKNPFGSGNAAKKIVDEIQKHI
ncbi:MAG: UDP-N-acetylglucosamine 2-epimerase, partial [Candidatus Micrarchaeia archaeon]